MKLLTILTVLASIGASPAIAYDSTAQVRKDKHGPMFCDKDKGAAVRVSKIYDKTTASYASPTASKAN